MFSSNLKRSCEESLPNLAKIFSSVVMLKFSVSLSTPVYLLPYSHAIHPVCRSESTVGLLFARCNLLYISCAAISTTHLDACTITLV